MNNNAYYLSRQGRQIMHPKNFCRDIIHYLNHEQAFVSSILANYSYRH